MNKISNPDVADKFNTYPEIIRDRLLFLRQLILDTASLTKEVGEIEETLKWGEPSYLTPVTKSGSTIRLNRNRSGENLVGIYFKCTADLVPAFKEKYPTEFKYEGDRCIVFDVSDNIPIKELRNCIALALTYHLNKKLRPNERWEFVENLIDH